MDQNKSIIQKNAQEYDSHAQSWQNSMSTNLGHKYLEKPAITKQLPETLKDKIVLCVGVGSGDELQEIMKRSPRAVTGIDISIKLLNIAKSRFRNVKFQKMDMAAMSFADSSFDFIYSSLTFHYASDWDTLCSELYRVLKKGGKLLFSTHHPDYWSRKDSTGNSYTNVRGVTLTEYTTVIPGDVTITYYNHPSTDTILESLTHVGFKIEKNFTPSVIEIDISTLSEQDQEKYIKLKKKNNELPLFYIVQAIKE